ncbi:MAG TPA: glycoside hydrolase family 3 N-terminal domain-containing protein [Candidatus Saccharimonadales bacterium]|nr:glycoside hydrolase family 3 N-terminal domain-containing protein [Candidatus Saccharimonadales bacterium]
MRKRFVIIGIGAIILLAGVGGLLAYQNDKKDNNPVETSSQSQKPQEQPSPSPPPLSYPDEVLAKMTLRDKIASLFLFHSPGTNLAPYLAAHKPAGLIFMGDNIPATLAELQFETKALITNPKLPPLLAVDEEGDTVKRLAADTFPGALTLPDMPPATTRDAFGKRSDLLKSVGLNLNFGIVADVTANPRSFIFPRVLGTTPQTASERVAQAVEGSKGKTLSTLKHFPGHGETNANSHTSIPTASTSYPDWQQRVALPFKAGIQAGADMVMFGHLRYEVVDDAPASLSKKWHDIARNELGFKGIIVTDDMIMLQNSGDSRYKDPVVNSITALQAGNNLLLFVTDHQDEASAIDPSVLINGIEAAVNDGRLDETVINENAKKLLTLRSQLAR